MNLICYTCNNKIKFNIYKAYDRDFCCNKCKYEFTSEYKYTHDYKLIHVETNLKKSPTYNNLDTNIQQIKGNQLDNNYSHTNLLYYIYNMYNDDQSNKH